MSNKLSTQVPSLNTTPASSAVVWLTNGFGGIETDDAASATNLIKKAHGLSDTTVLGVASGVIAPASTTGSGNVVLATSPALVTPTGIIKSDVGLGNVDNTSDVNKPVSTATQTALNLKANLASPTFTGTVTVPTPSNTTDASTKGYVDAVAQGLSAKTSVLLATAAVLPTNTYLSNVITITATGTLTIDGTVVSLNDRVLVKDESSGLKNGVYVVTTAGAGGIAAVLTRSTDMDVAAEFPGAFVFVESGTVNAAAGFVCTNSTPPTVGTTAITFTQFSGAGEITAGAGLTKTGNTLDVGAGTGITVNANDVAIDTAVVARKSDNLSVFAATTSAQLAGVLSDETGSGSAVFANAPALISPTFSGSLDGWIADTNTWTYSSATVFTVAADVTGYIKKGTKISYNDGAVDYGVVLSAVFAAGTTTVTLITNDDYAIANTTLTAPRYSLSPAPIGYPFWFNWTPTLSGWSANPTNTVYQYRVDGDAVQVLWRQSTAGTSNSVTHTGTAPVTAATITNASWGVLARGTDNGTVQTANFSIASASTTFTLQGVFASNTNTASGNSNVSSVISTYRF